MKDIKENLKFVLKSRLMVLIMFLVLFFGIVFFLATIFGAKPVDQLIYTRYTAFGGEHFYKDVWFVRIFVALLGLIVAFLHNLLIAKIYVLSGRKTAIFFAGISIFLIIISAIVAFSVLREIPN